MELIKFIEYVKKTETGNIPPYVLLDKITNIEVGENNIIIKTKEFTLELGLKHKQDDE